MALTIIMKSMCGDVRNVYQSVVEIDWSSGAKAYLHKDQLDSD